MGRSVNFEGYEAELQFSTGNCSTVMLQYTSRRYGAEGQPNEENLKGLARAITNCVTDDNQRVLICVTPNPHVDNVDTGESNQKYSEEKHHVWDLMHAIGKQEGVTLIKVKKFTSNTNNNVDYVLMVLYERDNPDIREALEDDDDGDL